MRDWRIWVVILAIVLPSVAELISGQVLPVLDGQLEDFEAYKPPLVCKVYDDQGQLFDEFALVRRVWVDLEEIPDVAWQAIIAAEDNRFFKHIGVDPIGIGRAAWVNLQAGTIEEGGSTLTQQLVKNTVVGNARSYQRKAMEALLAIRLEHRHSKEEILELYLNYVYLGSGNYGVEAAAQDYFGVSARELSAGQAALLAGLIPSPSAWSPRRDLYGAMERRDRVLEKMVELDYLSEQEAERAMQEPVDPPERQWDEFERGTSYRTAVRREVRRVLGDEWPFGQGLRIHTPINHTVQLVAEDAVRKAAQAVQVRQGHNRPTRRLLGVDLEAAMGPDFPGLEGDPTTDDCFESVYMGSRQVGSKGQTFKLTGTAWTRRVRPLNEKGSKPSFGYVVREGHVVKVCKVEREGYVDLAPADWVEGAAVVMEIDTGKVVAMVGGTNETLEGFNRANQGRRQAGSSFKPYVYATAMADGMTQIDRVLDGPVSYPGGNGKRWSPRNYDRRYRGWLPLWRAFALSLNTVAVRLIDDASPAAVVQLARRIGITSPLREDLTLALGSSEITPMEHAMGIAAFTRMGHSVDPVYISRIEDFEGNLLGEAGEKVEGLDVTLPGGPGEVVIRPAVAWEVLDLMRGTVREGTGRRAFKEGFERGGKTGTTSNFQDAWFVGFTSEHVVVVWIGNDLGGTMGPKETGGRAALPAWMAIVDALEGDTPATPLQPPHDVLMVPYAGRWIGLPDDEVPASVMSSQRVAEGAPLPEFQGGKQQDWSHGFEPAPAPRPAVDPALRDALLSTGQPFEVEPMGAVPRSEKPPPVSTPSAVPQRTPIVPPEPQQTRPTPAPAPRPTPTPQPRVQPEPEKLSPRERRRQRRQQNRDQ